MTQFSQRLGQIGIGAFLVGVVACGGSETQLSPGAGGTAGTSGSAGSAGSSGTQSGGSSGSNAGSDQGGVSGDAGQGGIGGSSGSSAGSNPGGSGGVGASGGNAGVGGSTSTGGSGGVAGSVAGNGGVAGTSAGSGAISGQGGIGGSTSVGGSGGVGGVGGSGAVAGSAGTAGSSAGGNSGTAGGGTAGTGVGPAGPLGAGPGGSSGNAGSAGSAGGVLCNTDPNVDDDGDGWTENEGDCNDCDPIGNPGALDVFNYDPMTMQALPPEQQIDEDCDGTPVQTNTPSACDMGLALNDTVAIHGANAIDLCKQTVAGGPAWGVISAQYVRANGNPTNLMPNAPQVGIQSTLGPNVIPQMGSNMLMLSSGFSRTPGQQNACNNQTCNSVGQGTAPAGFPQDPPNCPVSQNINDDVALELRLLAPTNATGFKFRFKFYSFEYPEWVCNTYNDQFVALVNPAPDGAINGNISFDSQNNPVSVNIAFFDVCQGCSQGTNELQGTGFDVWNDAGATTWLTTQSPLPKDVNGGFIRDFTIRFAIWDTGDAAFDSSVLIDGFEWIANGSDVQVGTMSCNSGGMGECGACALSSIQDGGCCRQQFLDCYNNADCQNLTFCLNPCSGNASCIQNCRDTFPAGVPFVDAQTDCIYGPANNANNPGACGTVCMQLAHR